MYLTHPDQMAKIREFETDEPMFPKGVKQMLGFIYAMEGEIAGRMSWHAKMVDLREAMERGYIHPFSLHKINLKGLDAIMINGECAGLRNQVERMLCGQDLESVLAKFGKDELKRTQDSVAELAEDVRVHLTSGRRKMQRSREYCADLVWNVSCCHALYEKRFNPTSIARRYQMNQPIVWKDCDAAKHCISRMLESAYKKIEEKFRDGVVLPCVAE